MFKKHVVEVPDVEVHRQSAAENDDVETVVGPSVHVEGDFASEGNILVKGSVSGSVKTSKLLTVETGAKILANVRAGSAHIAGEIRGNVKIADSLELSSTAQIFGDISCSTLAIEAGAIVQGKVNMRGSSASDEVSEVSSGRTRRKRTSSTEEMVA